MSNFNDTCLALPWYQVEQTAAKLAGPECVVRDHGIHSLGDLLHAISYPSFVGTMPLEEFDMCYAVNFFVFVSQSFLAVFFALVVKFLFERYPYFEKKLDKVLYVILDNLMDNPFAATAGFNRANRRPIGDLTSKTFKVVDGNKLMNRKALEKAYFWFNRGRNTDVSEFFGRTEVLGVVLPFPVYCDRKTAERFILKFMKLPNHERRRLLTDGVMTPAMKDLCICLFAPVLRTVDSFTAGSLRIHPLFCVFFSYFIPAWLCPPFHIWYYVVNMAGTYFGKHICTWFYVIAEELFNSFFGVHIVAIYEFIARVHMDVWGPSVAVVMHLFMCFLPFPIRVFLHRRWNNVALEVAMKDCVSGPTLGFLQLEDEDHFFACIEDVSYAADLVLKIYRRDKLGIVTSIGMKAHLFKTLRDIFSEEGGAEQLADILCSDLCSESDGYSEDGRAILALNDTLPSSLFRWLPKEVTSSPTFSRISAFVGLILFSKFFSGVGPLNYIGSTITSEDFVEGVDLASIVASAASAVAKAFRRVFETGSVSSFFEKPRDLAFIEESMGLLYVGDLADDEKAILAKVAAANRLIASRSYEKNTPLIERTLLELRKFVKEKIAYCKSWKPRDQPMLVWLNGSPGTGKTTIMQAVMDVITRVEAEEHFLGDVINYQLFDKYPTSTGANELARHLIINDIADDYTDFPNRDLMPLEIVMQQVLDTTPYSPRAAAIEDKGKVYSKLNTLIMTSNHKSYKFSSATEKLDRRIQSGVVVEVFVVDEKGAPVSFDKFKEWPMEVRNLRTRYRVLEASCFNLHVKLKDTATVFDLVGFLQYVEVRWRAHKAANSKAAVSFSSQSSRCSCGVSESLHLAQIDGNKSWRRLSESCTPPPPPPPLLPMTLGMVDSVSELYDDLSGEERRNAVLVPFLMYLSNYHFVAQLCFWALQLWWVFHFVPNTWIFALKDSFYLKFIKLEGELALKLLEHPVANRCLETLALDLNLERIRMVTIAARRWKEFKEWLHKYKFWFALAIGGAALYKLQSVLCKEKPLALAKPIYGEQVVPGSFGISGYTSQQSFPTEVQAGWKKPDTNMQVAVLTTFGVSREHLSEVCRANMASAKIVTPTFDRENATVFFLTPEYICFNKHYLLNERKHSAMSELEVGEFIVDGSSTSFKRKDLLSTAGTEFYILKLNHSMARRGLLRFLLKEPYHRPCDVEHLRVDGTVFKTVAQPTVVSMHEVAYPMLEWKAQPIPGMCSEPVIAVINGNAVLLGCVAYGKMDGSAVGCCVFSRKWFDECVKDVILPLVEDLVFELPSDKPIQPLSLKSEFRNVASVYANPVGTYDGPARTMKTKLRRTRVADHFERFLSKKYEPPGKLRGIGLDGEYHSVVTHTFANIDMPCDLTREESTLIVNAMLEDFASPAFIRDNAIKLAPLSLKEAIFGKAELNIGRTDFSTSVGPFVKAMGITDKHSMFEMIDEELEQYVLKPDILKRYERFEEVFASGVVLAPFSDMAAKDELRPTEKVGNFKIRLFFVLDVVFNLFARRYLMPLIVYILTFPSMCECYGGMNAGSCQWDDLARRLLTSDRSKRRFADFDFSTFDTTHHQMLFEAMASLFYQFALRVGYSEAEAKMVYFIFICFKWQIVAWMNDLMIKTKGMPSGVIFTLILNSMVNSFLMRLCYLRLARRPLKNFQKDVVTANVGDDNINSIAEEIGEQFNIITVAQCLRGVGYIATPAKKGAISQKFLEFEELSFVKRRFRWCDVLKQYVAPIEEDSIWRPFTYQQEDAGMSSVARLQEVARNALHESMLHGRDSFVQAKQRIFDGFNPANLVVPEVDYDALVSQYIDGDFRTFGLAGPSNEEYLGLHQNPNPSEPSENNKRGPEVMHGVVPLAPPLLERDTTLLQELIERNLPRYDCPGWLVHAIADFNANNNSGVSTEIGGVTSVVAEASQDVQAGYPRYVDVTSRPSDYKDFANHFVQIDHRTVTSASTVTINVSNNLLSTFMAIIAGNPVGRKLQNLVWSRSKLKVKIVVQGAPYAAGQVVACFTPNVRLSADIATMTTTGSSTNLVNSKIVPHLILDPSKTETYEITLPICTPSGTWYLMDPTELGSYKMDFVFFNPIFSGTAVSPVMNICTYMAFDTPSFEAVTALSNDDFVQEKKPGFLSSAAHALAKYSPLAALPFPQLAPGLTLFSSAAQGVGDFLYYLGFSKPPATENRAFALNRVVDNYSQCDGISTAIVLGCSQTHGLGLSAAHGGGNDEELLLANLCRKEGLIKQISVPASAASGTRVANIRVHPTYIASFGGTADGNPTPLAGVAIPFLYWSGDILLTVEVVASVFNRCTLLVAWDTVAANPSAPPNMETAMQTLPNAVISVAGNTSTQFRIPWAQHKPWRTIARYKSDQNSGLSILNNNCNGEVFVYVVNPLTSNGSPDPIAVNFYFSSDNIRFAVPSQDRLPTQTMSAGSWSVEGFAPLEAITEDLVAEDRYDTGIVRLDEEEILPLAAPLVAKPVIVEFGPKTDNFYLFQRTFGDLVSSVKGLTSRFGFLGKATYPAPSLNGLVYNFPNVSAPVGTAVMVSGGNSGNFLGYFAQAYLGYRGGVRHMVHVHDVSNGGSFIHHTYWTTHDVSTTPVATSAAAAALDLDNVTTQYAYSAMNRDLALNADFVAPLLIPYDFVPRGYTSALADSCRLTIGVQSTTATYELTHAVASADDGNFVWFLGFPPSPYS